MRIARLRNVSGSNACRSESLVAAPLRSSAADNSA
eukprot:CAMPEP_0168356564 /NCGR_PEP_ID=MMETSP0228-20121227/106_1 /TAXON_ID=133427 /ORGANISM="Protoceratium reticulatum, Strain CCCM 535 (=CCMP 1889)" /LENGTH=34 /DNA_ID= /DNA_START= /DNA_END= /DNA_ORIENTATION=